MTAQDFVNALRTHELNRIISRHPNIFDNRDLLEIGSGAGAQLLVFRQICKSAIGIETSLRSDAVADILRYDGLRIPFPDKSFDVVFSSHVMEHIREETSIHAEIHRVLRPGGRCLHIVPVASWRFWASVLHYPALLKKFADSLARRNGTSSISAAAPMPLAGWPRIRARLNYALIQRRHGEFGNWFSEHFLFRVSTWRKRFESHGWHVEFVEPVGFVQSGHDLLNHRLSWRARQLIAKILGSSSFLFALTESTPR